MLHPSQSPVSSQDGPVAIGRDGRSCASLGEPSLGGIKTKADNSSKLDQRREAQASVADLVRRQESGVVRQSTRADATGGFRLPTRPLRVVPGVYRSTRVSVDRTRRSRSPWAVEAVAGPPSSRPKPDRPRSAARRPSLRESPPDRFGPSPTIGAGPCSGVVVVWRNPL